MHTLSVNDKAVVFYTWGTGSSMILLVHGWRSRASRFGTLVQALARDDRTVISFDAPGHGDSQGSSTNVLEQAEIIRQLSFRYGPFDSIVGHSFGVLSVFHALRLGVIARRVVSSAGVHDLDHLMTTFVDLVALPVRAAQRMRTRVDRDLFAASQFTWSQIVSKFDDPNSDVPLLVLHDAKDRLVGLDQARLIERGHPGPTSTLYTDGLGHHQILTERSTVQAVAAFVSSGITSHAT